MRTIGRLFDFYNGKELLSPGAFAVLALVLFALAIAATLNEDIRNKIPINAAVLLLGAVCAWGFAAAIYWLYWINA